MKLRFLALSMLISGLLFGAQASQTDAKPVFHVFNFNDGSILQNISDNGEWGVAFGASQANSLWNFYPKLIEFSSNTVTELLTKEELDGAINCAAATDVTDDGKLVVGNYGNAPAIYHVDKAKWEKLPVPEAPKGYSWDDGYVNSVTPDGKWAVGTMSYNDYFGEIPVLWNLEGTPTIVETLYPIEDMSGFSQDQTRFMSITADGKKIAGCVSYSYPDDVMYFIYDIDSKTWVPVGYNYDDNDFISEAEGMHHIDGLVLSNDGKWATGSAYMVKSVAGSEFGNQYKATYLYDIVNDKFTIFDSTGDAGMVGNVVSNTGIIYASTPDGSPVREWYGRVGNYWYSFDQILKQVYDIEFVGATGYENTGTMWAMSNDGKRYVSFSYPQGESYMVELPETFAELSKKVDLLGNYTITPANGKKFSTLQTLQITFDRDVEVVGDASSVAIYDSEGNEIKAANKVDVKTGQTKVIEINFGRAVTLEANKRYNVVIPAGMIQIAGDPEQKNKEIRVNYTGREKAPVKMIGISPADGASVALVNLTSNPIVATFDADLTLCENLENTPKAHLYLQNEDNTEELLADMYALISANQLLVYPLNDQYLYEGSNYRVSIDAGTVADITGNNANEAISFTYKGSYVREITGDDNTIFDENFNDWSSTFAQILLYEGDHNAPAAEMAAFEFDADNTPWNFSLRDNDAADYAAASHSIYANKGKSDDWMSTPQLYIPDDKCVLTFDAQTLDNTGDKLKVVIWENKEVINILTDRVMEDYRANAKVILDKELKSGGSQNLAGEWEHFAFELAEYAGKEIYIGFVNENENKGMVFVDNVSVKRNAEFVISLETESTVVRQDDIEIKGRIRVDNETQTYTKATFTLKDAEGTTLETISEDGLALKQGDIYSFKFTNRLPLEYGKTVKYTVDVALDELKNSVRGSIKNLSFTPTKRVVVEKMTGNTCTNCPKGIIAFDLLHDTYGNLFIPVAIHTYTGDPFSSGLSAYSSFLNLVGAPTGVVNRSGVVTNPLDQDENGAWRYSNPNNPLWWDAVAAEFKVLSEADINVKNAVYDTANKTIDIPVTTKFAVDAEGLNLNLFAVILENSLDGAYQVNGLAGSSDPILGEWGQGGKYGQAVVPYTYDHVARGIYGTTWNGTGGLIPTNVASGEVYENTLSLAIPETIRDIKNCEAVVMLIDANNGKVLNAAVGKLYDVLSVDGINQDSDINIIAIRDNVVVTADGEAQVEIFGVNGAVINRANGYNNITVETNGYRGIAIVRVTTENKSEIRKVVIR